MPNEGISKESSQNKGEGGALPSKANQSAVVNAAENKEQPTGEVSVGMLAAIQKHRLHRTGFSFYPKTGPMFISDWQYTPTPCRGAFVKKALVGKIFSLKKLR